MLRVSAEAVNRPDGANCTPKNCRPSLGFAGRMVATSKGGPILVSLGSAVSAVASSGALRAAEEGRGGEEELFGEGEVEGGVGFEDVDEAALEVGAGDSGDAGEWGFDVELA